MTPVPLHGARPLWRLRTAKWRMNDRVEPRGFSSRGFRSRYVVMELEARWRPALPVVGIWLGGADKGNRKRNDRGRKLRQDQDCRCWPDKLPHMSDRLAQRTFGRVVIHRNAIARGSPLIRFRLDRS